MKASCVKCAQGRYPVDAALGENSREIAEIARECGAMQVFALRRMGPWGALFDVFVELIPFTVRDAGLILVVCFPAADGGEPGVGEL